jgi:hypothetical protein
LSSQNETVVSLVICKNTDQRIKIAIRQLGITKIKEQEVTYFEEESKLGL